MNVTSLNRGAAIDARGNILALPSQAWTAALDLRLLQVGFKLNF
jgi:hypothetical protein